MMSDEQDQLQRIAVVLGKTLTMEQVDADLDLLESGMLDSLSLMQLIVNLEEQFSIQIEPEEIDIDDYRTVRSMSLLIDRLHVRNGISVL